MDWIGRTVIVVVAVSVAGALLRKLRRYSISDIRGPDDSASFFMGPSTPLRLVLRLALTERVEQDISRFYGILNPGSSKTDFWKSTGM